MQDRSYAHNKGMLMNGGLNGTSSKSTAANSRHSAATAAATAAGDALSHPSATDRRNPAASSASDNTSMRNSSGNCGADPNMNESHQREKERGSSLSHGSSFAIAANDPGGHSKRVLVGGGCHSKNRSVVESFKHRGAVDYDNYDNYSNRSSGVSAVGATSGSESRARVLLGASGGHPNAEHVTMTGRGRKGMELGVVAGAASTADGALSATTRTGDMTVSKPNKGPLVAPLYSTVVASAKGRAQTVTGPFPVSSEKNHVKHAEQHPGGEPRGQRPGAHSTKKTRHYGHPRGGDRGDPEPIGMDADEGIRDLEVMEAIPMSAVTNDGETAKIKAREVAYFASSTGATKKRKEMCGEDDKRAHGSGGGGGASSRGATTERAPPAGSAHWDDDDVEMVQQVQAAAFASPDSALEYPPLGEGWDDDGNDISKILNDAIRKGQCEAWAAKLRQEASAIRAGDHPEVVRRSVTTVDASKKRNQICEKYARRQQITANRLYELEVESIQASYEAAMDQTRERLMSEVNEEIKRSKSRMEGFKEVENRMNTRHTRGNAKGAIEDPFLAQTTGSKTNGNSKRPLCPISLVLEDDDLTEDIDFLRYSGHERNNGGEEGVGGERDSGRYNYDMSSGVSGRARRSPAWRRVD